MAFSPIALFGNMSLDIKVELERRVFYFIDVLRAESNVALKVKVDVDVSSCGSR